MAWVSRPDRAPPDMRRVLPKVRCSERCPTWTQVNCGGAVIASSPALTDGSWTTECPGRPLARPRGLDTDLYQTGSEADVAVGVRPCLAVLCGPGHKHDRRVGGALGSVAPVGFTMSLSTA
jgi:hypothetical protein